MNTHVVRQLPSDKLISGWDRLCQRTFDKRILQQNRTSDYLIIGAGFAGLAAARRLLQLEPQQRITVLEARAVAQGASGRNSGFMIDVPHNLSASDYSVGDAASTRLEIAQNRRAIQFAADAASEYGMTPTTFDPSGQISAAATARGARINAAFAQSLDAIGEAYSMLDRQQMQEITGSSYYLNGIHTPGTVLIQPARFIHHVADGLSPTVDIFEDSPVTRLEQVGSDWKASTPQGSVTAPRVILAVNGHIQSFGFFRQRLLHIVAYASMTPDLRPEQSGKSMSGHSRWALLPADPMGATVRRYTDASTSRIVIRTHFTYDPSMQISPRRHARIMAHEKKSLYARFPQLAGMPMAHTWAGLLCLSLNQSAAFGELEPGLFSACCCNGLGTVKSTLNGIMAAELASQHDSPELTAFQQQAMPRRIPPQPLSWLGANALMSWQQWRAGKEA